MTSTPPHHHRKKTSEPLATETDKKFVAVKPQYGISDQPAITAELEKLKVGESHTYDSISGSLLANLMSAHPNYLVELIDCFGNPAKLALDGRNIYAAFIGAFRREPTYHVTRVKATNGTYREKWARVFNTYDWLDNKAVFNQVRFTRKPFWYRTKSPKVD